jgi:choline dehydrogenase-like flavoprotein
MPDIVSANTNAASMMIGWRAGGIILGEERAAPTGAEREAGTAATAG